MLKKYEEFNLNESEPMDETPGFIEDAVTALMPILDSYAGGIDAARGDVQNAMEHFLEKLMLRLREECGLD